MLEWYEQLPAPVHALVVTVFSIGGLFLAIAGREFGAFGALLLYTAGWLHRHTCDPAAHPYLDPEKHGKSYFHPGSKSGNKAADGGESE